MNKRQATELVKRACACIADPDMRALLAAVWADGYESAGAILHDGVNPFEPGKPRYPTAQEMRDRRSAR
jgi:hypothetical protein